MITFQLLKKKIMIWKSLNTCNLYTILFEISSSLKMYGSRNRRVKSFHLLSFHLLVFDFLKFLKSSHGNMNYQFVRLCIESCI